MGEAIAANTEVIFGGQSQRLLPLTGERYDGRLVRRDPPQLVVASRRRRMMEQPTAGLLIPAL